MRGAYVDVILPLFLQASYTYAVPDTEEVREGDRVLVQFGKKRIYTAVVLEIHDRAPEAYEAKPILEILDRHFAIRPEQLRYWRWMAQYYLCSMGDVMQAALPHYLKLQSESRLYFDPDLNRDYEELDKDELQLWQYGQEAGKIGIDEAYASLGKNRAAKAIQGLIAKQWIQMEEEVDEKYKPSTRWMIRATTEDWEPLFKEVQHAPKQRAILLAFFDLREGRGSVDRKKLLKRAQADLSSLRSLLSKGGLMQYEERSDRTAAENGGVKGGVELSPAQKIAVAEILEQRKTHGVVLLHGVTSSGKTEMYMHLIQRAFEASENTQVLFLLPEIALTAQMEHRLRRVFGQDLVLYHSRMSHAQRLETYEKVIGSEELGYARLIVGARSALFLPYRNLSLVIVDEAHDYSYKQHSPAPRYHGRDAAIYLASLFYAQVILGTATPSMETLENVRQKKFGYVRITERYCAQSFPEINLVDVRKYRRPAGKLLTDPMKVAIDKAISEGMQVILFQNRRGFSPRLECEVCQWTRYCDRCDVATTYHKASHQLRCHYCGSHYEVPKVCPACKSGRLSTAGFGTERCEDEIHEWRPDLRVKRMDLDTTRGKKSLQKLVDDFHSGEIDVLVGTQMVTKGLDFDRVALIGVLDADQLLRFPDFRADERTFQTLVQVSGRAGRKHGNSLVLIQTAQPDHPTLQRVVNNAPEAFYSEERVKREAFGYPPYRRLVSIRFRHRNPERSFDAAQWMASFLRQSGVEEILGPEPPLVARIKNEYHQRILIKRNPAQSLIKVNELLLKGLQYIERDPRLRSVRIDFDADPQQL